MKTLIALLALATAANAQDIENIPDEQAQKVARKIIAGYGAPADAPFTIEADTEKVSGIKGGEAGLLALPDKKLTAETIAAAGRDAKGIGQLWMHKVVPAVDKAAPDAAKLRSVEFGEDDQKKKAEVYYLSVNKDDKGALTLALTAKDKEPLVKVPLVKTDAAASTTPISLSGHKEGEHSGVLVVTVFGSYKADVLVTKPRE